MSALSRASPTDMFTFHPLEPMASRLRSSRPWRALAALFLTFAFTACNMQTKTFDSETWKAQRGAEATANKRVHMVSELEAAVHVGMPRAEVIRLLGEPDSRRVEKDTDLYFLGLSMGPDEQYYEIRYEDGKIALMRLGQF